MPSGTRSVEINFQLTNLTVEPLTDVRVTLSADPALVVTPSALTFAELGKGLAGDKGYVCHI